MSDYATGAGLTTTLYASLATSKAELSLLLSEFNRDVANAAIVAMGLEELEKLEPGISTLASSLVKERLLALDRGEDQPAVFSFLARTYVNYS